MELSESDNTSSRQLRNIIVFSKNKLNTMAHHGRKNPSKKARKRMRIARERAAELQQRKESKDKDIKTERGGEGEKGLDGYMDGCGSEKGGLGEMKREEAGTEGDLWDDAVNNMLGVEAGEVGEQEEKKAVKLEPKPEPEGEEDSLRRPHSG